MADRKAVSIGIGEKRNEFLKQQAKKHDISIAAYVRNLIDKEIAADKKTRGVK